VAKPHSACRCAALDGHPCANAITREDLLCDMCRRNREVCMVILLGDPPEPLFGHQPYAPELLEGVRFRWQGPEP
jgi:hypothetical protein